MLILCHHSSSGLLTFREESLHQGEVAAVHHETEVPAQRVHVLLHEVGHVVSHVTRVVFQPDDNGTMLKPARSHAGEMQFIHGFQDSSISSLSSSFILHPYHPLFTCIRTLCGLDM